MPQLVEVKSLASKKVATQFVSNRAHQEEHGYLPKRKTAVFGYGFIRVATPSSDRP